LIAYLTLGPFESLGASFAFSVFESFVLLLIVVSVVVTVEERLFWPYVARQTRDTGLEIHIQRVEYRRFYHPVVASAGGRPFQLTIGGLPRRIRRAVALAAAGAGARA
jgi:hypothetical protein